LNHFNQNKEIEENNEELEYCDKRLFR